MNLSYLSFGFRITMKISLKSPKIIVRNLNRLLVDIEECVVADNEELLVNLNAKDYRFEHIIEVSKYELSSIIFNKLYLDTKTQRW